MGKTKKVKQFSVAVTEVQYNFLTTYLNKNLSLAYKIRNLIDEEIKRQNKKTK